MRFFLLKIKKLLLQIAYLLIGFGNNNNGLGVIVDWNR